jgi:hypothetical protein
MTDHIQICRIQYLGLDNRFGFALYQASTESYVDARLPDGSLTGTPRQALDTALGLYLNDPTAWHTETPEGLTRGCTRRVASVSGRGRPDRLRLGARNEPHQRSRLRWIALMSLYRLVMGFARQQGELRPAGVPRRARTSRRQGAGDAASREPW